MKPRGKPDSKNRQIERTYRELTRDIENILGSITDFFFDIANDGDIEQAFRDLGSRIGNAVLGEFEQAIAGKIAKSITGEVAGAGAGTSGGLAGLGSIASLFTNPATIAAAFLAFPAYGAYQHLTDDDIAPAGQGRGIAPVGGLPTEPFTSTVDSDIPEAPLRPRLAEGVDTYARVTMLLQK